MDKDTQVSCPPLPVFSFHENLVVSSLSNAVGSVVEFRCTGGENEILSGSSVLVCTTTGKWNGSIPTCIDKDESTSAVIPDTTEPILSTTAAASTGELEVETVLIILWVAGGLLLISLVVLMACILRSHKKQQRNRSERLPRGQNNPRHGGVNPTFSTYDEIWTWIPVLTDNAGHCRNQASASTRESSANQTNNDLIRNLRLPTYNEAVSSPTTVTSSSQNQSRPSNTAPSNQRSIVPYRQTNTQRQTMSQSNDHRSTQVSVPNNQNRGPNSARTAPVHRTVVNVRETRAESSRCQNRESANTNMTVVSSDHHHYETIPADVIGQSNVRTYRGNAGRVHVTTPSGSALQQARDLVSQFCEHAQRPQPSAPEQPRVSNELRRDYHPASRTYIHPSIEPLADISRSRAQENRSVPQHPHRYAAHHSSHDFRHSDGSRFEYYADNRRRVRSNTTSAHTTEPPPPYSAIRESSSQARDCTSSIMSHDTSSALATTSLRTGLECQYF